MQNTNLAPYEQIFSIVNGMWQARALAVVTELGLPDLLTDGPMHVDELASRTQTDALALFRLLRALESVGFFVQASPRVFVHSPKSEYLCKDAPNSQRSFVLSALSIGNGQIDGWNELGYAIKTGAVALTKVYGHDFWEFCRRNIEAGTLFNDCMRSVTEAMTPAVTASYDWSRFPVIIDVGGGIGTQLVSILNAFVSCRGILFDQPQMLAESIKHDRMEKTDGDFFTSVPAGADAYLMRYIIHDWTEQEAIAILRVLHLAMKPEARIILAETIVPEGSDFEFSKWLDLHMLVTFGGRERTEEEYRSLLSAAGFELTEVVPTSTPMSLLVARPV